MHKLTQNIINSKLKGNQGPINNQTAKIAYCFTRTIRRHRRNVLLYRSTKAPSNSANRPKTVTPPILITLCDKLAIDPCIYLKDIVAFLYSEFKVDVNRFNIHKALKDIS
jgi:hypothetical protein